MTKRITDRRLQDELPDADIPAFGYGQRELQVIDRLFDPAMPDGELLNLYFLVHDRNSDLVGKVFKEPLARIEAVVTARMSGQDSEPERPDWPGFEPEAFREATEAVCDGGLTDLQLLEMYAIAEAMRGDEEVGHRWQAVMDLCRAQILRRMKTARAAASRRAESETLPPPATTSASAESRITEFEAIGRRIAALRDGFRMPEVCLAQALNLKPSDVRKLEAGEPLIDSRLALSAMITADEQTDPAEQWRDMRARSIIAHSLTAMMRMPPPVRDIWLMRRAEGLKTADIAARRGVSVSRIRERLREGQQVWDVYGPKTMA